MKKIHKKVQFMIWFSLEKWIIVLTLFSVFKKVIYKVISVGIDILNIFMWQWVLQYQNIDCFKENSIWIHKLNTYHIQNSNTVAVKGFLKQRNFRSSQLLTMAEHQVLKGQFVFAVVVKLLARKYAQYLIRLELYVWSHCIM